MKSNASLRGNVEKSDGSGSEQGPSTEVRRARDSQGSEAFQHIAPGDGHKKSQRAPELELRSARFTLILRDSQLKKPELAPLDVFLKKHGSRRADLTRFIESCCRLYF